MPCVGKYFEMGLTHVQGVLQGRKRLKILQILLKAQHSEWAITPEAHIA
jgi:hypothetical protein